MKYIKTYEDLQEEGFFYEKDEAGFNTGYRVLMTVEECQILYDDGLVFFKNEDVDRYDRYYAEILDGKFYTKIKDRQIILDKLELMRTANKYNL